MSDLISRADAIEAIASRDETDRTVKVFTGREVNEILSALPSADVVSRDDLIKAYEKGLQAQVVDLTADRPTGKWVDNHNGTFTCDQCGCKHSKSNYCPNCGAYMKGENK